MTDIITFNSFDEADVFCKSVDAKLGYPNPETKTERYTEIEKGVDNKWYVATNSLCPINELAKIPAVQKIANSDIKRDVDTGAIKEVKGVVLKKPSKIESFFK